MADSGLDNATDGYLSSTCDIGETGYCGTGYNQITYPGDPDLSNGYLIASGSFAGITLTWTLPADAHAVSYVRIYKSTSDSFLSASWIASAGGSYYFDDATDLSIGTRFYYWIELVSINGTVGDVIGPASAVMQPLVLDLLSYLEGQISQTQLAQDLRAPIQNIGVLASSLDAEIQERFNLTGILNDLYGGLQAQLDEFGTLIYEETAQRRTEDSALAIRITGLGAKLDGSVALIKEEQGAILQILGDGTTDGLVYDLTQLDLVLGEQEGSLQTLAQIVGNSSTGLAAQWMVKTDINGYVAGFGLYNDGATSQFIVNADTFAVGLPEKEGVYPFYITEVNGETVIGLNAKTLIQEGQLTMAMVDEYLSSSNYVDSDSPGWFLGKDGTFHVKGADGVTILKSEPGGGPVQWPNDISNDQQLWEDITGAGRPEDYSDVTMQNEVIPVIGWTFNGEDEGFTGVSYVYPDKVQTRSELTSPYILNSDDEFWFKGSRAGIVRARVRTFGGSTNWVGELSFYTTTQGWRSAGAVAYPGNKYTVLEWDLSANSYWKSGFVGALKFNFRGDTNETRVDWVAVGRRGSALSKIDKNNIGLYIANASIDNAQIKDLTVDTLKIKDDAVTVPQTFDFDGGATGGFNIPESEGGGILIFDQLIEWDDGDLTKKWIELPETTLIQVATNWKPVNNGTLNESSIRLGIQINDGGVFWMSTNIQQGFPGIINLTYSHGRKRSARYRIYARASRIGWRINRYWVTMLGAKK